MSRASDAILPIHRSLGLAPAIRAADPASLHHEGVRKDSSGYALSAYAAHGDPIDLLVGSEGTLALFVGLELALTTLPPATASLLAAFPTLDTAMLGATATLSHEIVIED